MTDGCSTEMLIGTQMHGKVATQWMFSPAWISRLCCRVLFGHKHMYQLVQLKAFQLLHSFLVSA